MLIFQTGTAFGWQIVDTHQKRISRFVVYFLDILQNVVRRISTYTGLFTTGLHRGDLSV